MNIARSASFNILAFILTMCAFLYYADDPVVSIFFSELVALFIAVVHKSRREILPPIAIFVVFKLLTSPISLILFSPDTIHSYLMSAILLNGMLIALLGKYYRNSFLRGLFKVNTPSRLIPQVLAMITVLSAGMLHHSIILIEVYAYQYDSGLFSGMPFFYTHYEGVKIVIKGLLLLAIWSMCLDSYFVDYERYRRLTGVVKTN